MNICFFSKEYPPETHIGGIGTYTYNMAVALSRLGHAVHVIASTQDRESTIRDDGVWVHRVKYRNSKLKEWSIFRYSRSVARKVSEIDCRFDIIQSSEFESEAFWYALRRKYPLVTRLATPYFLIEQMNGKVFIGPRPLFNWMEKKQTLCSDGIFTSTRAIAKEVAEKWRIRLSNVHIIPNSVDISRVIKLGKERPPECVPAGESYLLYFGRLEERKGVHILSRALPAVFKHHPGIRMVFAGSDTGYRGNSMRDYIKNATAGYEDRIVFLDNLPQEKLFPLVNAAKIVILPSLWEAFGFVCVEAMALSRPVIATSGSGFEEIIENDISGYLVEPGSMDLLAEKIISGLNNEENLQRISEGARRRARDFEVSHVALKLLALYEKIQEEWLKKKEGRGLDS